jgi:SAM-dependent methyltransferase
VTANFDTVNHLLDERDLATLFRRVHRHLRPSGHFIFDFITPCDPPSGTLHFRASRNGDKHVAQRIRWHPSRRLLLYDIVFREQARAPRVEFHRERAYAPHDVARWLAEAGFTLRDVLDASTLERAARCPARAIAIAQKRG